MNREKITRDYFPTQQWRTIDATTSGIQVEKLHYLDEMIRSQYSNVNGIVIVRRGYIVFEKYYNNHNPNDTHHVASVTKSIVSALVGIATDMGFIKSVEQKVLDFFPELKTASNDLQKRALTIKHLLTMTAPFTLAWKDGQMTSREPLDRLRRQRNWTQYIFKSMSRNGQLGRFQYSTAGTHLLSVILTRATGISTREFANEYLFRPLGMKEIADHDMKSFQLDDVFGDNVTGWVKDPQGYTTGGWGITLTPRDMARFGFLYLNDGVWDDQQIISKTWIERSTVANLNNYGYLWWIREEKTKIYSALGAGGNVICCMPEKDVVVAIASKIVRRTLDPWVLLDSLILPTID
ncbi:MAG: serine hydrolase [Chloroflexota bacterium]